ncbi:MAG: hypothetical protein Q7R81_06580 [Candidatus Peregrinibacteria bacterium]|nr:hypothetical protein [Candidatus Peregrinibacteria bacterium]
MVEIRTNHPDEVPALPLDVERAGAEVRHDLANSLASKGDESQLQNTIVTADAIIEEERPKLTALVDDKILTQEEMDRLIILMGGGKKLDTIRTGIRALEANQIACKRFNTLPEFQLHMGVIDKEGVPIGRMPGFAIGTFSVMAGQKELFSRIAALDVLNTLLGYGSLEDSKARCLDERKKAAFIRKGIEDERPMLTALVDNKILTQEEMDRLVAMMGGDRQKMWDILSALRSLTRIQKHFADTRNATLAKCFQLHVDSTDDEDRIGRMPGEAIGAFIDLKNLGAAAINQSADFLNQLLGLHSIEDTEGGKG